MIIGKWFTSDKAKHFSTGEVKLEILYLLMSKVQQLQV